MNTLEVICSRRSVRSYNGPLKDEELAAILKAAYAAPVGRGLYQNVQLSVITNKEILDELDENTAASLGNPDLHPLYHAPVFILVSAKLSSPDDNVAYSNCAIIVENMALAAVEMGLGSCHIWGAVRALNRNEKLVEKLNLSEGFTPCCGIVLGHTDEIYTEREISTERMATQFIK